MIDQRGHGHSDKAETYKPIDYVNDLTELIKIENLINPILLGHSLGGVVSYYYASQNNNVKAIIVEDIGTEINCSNEFIMNIPKDLCQCMKYRNPLKKSICFLNHILWKV